MQKESEGILVRWLPSFDWLTTVTPLGHTKILHVFSLVPIVPSLQLAEIRVSGESTLQQVTGYTF